MEVEKPSIRRIGADEMTVFKRIRLEALRCEPASFASRYEDWEALPEDQWLERLKNPVFVVFDIADPVGLMGLLRFGPAKMVHRATLVMVYIRKNFRGTGIARDLLSVVCDYAREQGITQLELSVSAENISAIRFYQREGFSEVARMPNGFLDGTTVIDEVTMMRALFR